MAKLFKVRSGLEKQLESFGDEFPKAVANIKEGGGQAPLAPTTV